MKKIFQALKARLYAKPFDIYNEKIISNPKFKTNDGKYWIHKDQIYFGHPLGVFFKSNQKMFKYKK